MSLLTFILTILAFGLMIAIHELGHFIAARKCGVEVEKFSIGFGAALAHFVKNGVEYRIGWIPLGGYVRMKGENPDDDELDGIGAFQSSVWWKKGIIALSGPMANLILGFFLFFLAYALPRQIEDHYPTIAIVAEDWISTFEPGDTILKVNGNPVIGWYQALSELSQTDTNEILILRDSTETAVQVNSADLESFVKGVQPVILPIVGDLQTGMPAWKAGLKSGDHIIAIDSVQISNWYEMRELIVGTTKDSIELTLKRGDEIYSRNMPLEKSFMTDNLPMIGITQFLPVRYQHKGEVGQSLVAGFYATQSFIVMNYKGLFHLIQKPAELKNSLGGPVMIVSMSQQVGQKGLGYLVLFFGSISLILMIMNLLPIPILDGGHILFAIIEGIIQKPIPVKAQALLQRIGFSLLIMLMIYASYNDIMKWLVRLING